MRRTATSLKRGTMTIEDFQKQAFFKVHEVPTAYLHRQNELDPGEWVKNPDRKALVRDDGSYVATVGRNYSIVQNKDFFENVIETLTESGIEYEPRYVFVDRNGARTTMVVRLPQFTMFRGTNEEQDAELRIGNSFDTSWAAQTLLGWLRLICTNGAMAFTEDFSFRMIHKGDINEKAKQAIELYKNFENVWTKDKEIIEELASRNGRRHAVANYFGDGETSGSSIFKGPRWAKKFLQTWQDNGEPLNLWDIYNIQTNLISHSFGHNYTSKLQSMQMLNKEVKSWNRIFDARKAA